MTNKYKSKLEIKVANLLKSKRIKFDYESVVLPFVQPAKKRKYTPDFPITKTGYLIEVKGKLTKDDRDKLLWAREQNPDAKIVILFQKQGNPIRKGSKTTYADWAEANQFEYSEFPIIPERWYK